MTKRRLKHCGRKKAWIGAAISAGTQLIGGIVGAIQKNKEARRQYEEQQAQNQFNFLANQAQVNQQNLETQNEIDAMNRVAYKKGGKRKLRNQVAITDGGFAIPIDYDTYLLRGASHDDVNETGQTGIGLNIGGKEIEAENGEVIKRTGNTVKILSDKIHLPNGATPAQAVLAGINPDAAFAAQERVKNACGGRHKAACGGRRRLRCGGKSPVRKKAANGDVYNLLKAAKDNNPTYTYEDFITDLQGNYQGTTDKNIKDAWNWVATNAPKNLNQVIDAPFMSHLSRYENPVSLSNMLKSDKDFGDNSFAMPHNMLTLGNKTVDQAVKDIDPGKVIDNPTIKENLDKDNAEKAATDGPNWKAYGADWTNLGINVAGSIATDLVRQHGLSSLRKYAPESPLPMQAGKLNTRVDVSSQLAGLERGRTRMTNNYLRNTASSAGLLSRLGTLNTNTIDAQNQVINQAEGQRRELINKDILNQQQVRNQNIQAYNNWRDRYNSYMANIRNERIAADTDMIKGIGGAATDFIQAGLDNAADEKNRRWLAVGRQTGTPETAQLQYNNLGYPPYRSRGYTRNGYGRTVNRCGGKIKLRNVKGK